MKKTQTKAFSNLVVSLLLIALEVFAWVQTGNIKTAKNAAVQPSAFPRIMIIGMTAFTVILLVQSVIKLLKMEETDPLAQKTPSMNFVKDKGVLAALFLIALCALYVWGFRTLGYVLVSMILSGIVMWLIGVRKPVQLVLIAVLVPLGMWLVFYKLLQVNIPMGVLQFLRDLVDKF